jgi:prepilin-type N-terminal cleavage/methylation domain-containing protein
MKRARRQAGFTMMEMVVVMAIVGIAAAMAVPSWRATMANSRLRDAAGDVADLLSAARARAISNNRTFVVYFDTLGGGEDVCGNPLEDLAGNPVPMLALDDANGNCCIDAGEALITRPAARGVFWGTDFAPAASPDDTDPAGTWQLGSTFHDPANSQTEWVAFRGDGIPVGFPDSGGACTLGTPGTGAGGIYLNNDRRDMAVVLTALGSVKVHGFEAVGGTWTD